MKNNINTQVEATRKWVTDDNDLSLERLLDEVSVSDVDDETSSIKGWFAVSNTEGIIAYFGDESEAFKYRLDFINRVMNG